ncbi:unnamed protein product [Parascedosporium putredinis]|uniref:NAD-dependent epimerase/dehydratase domain-containing protein n=1 Tax=Parascedosporium putredinis TaxID=1442378 RepID=A0A9P1M5Y9_9PEZI|nr:unnamed protein product [Parascedosporium putredinis]CAI7988680.1 unnamed protein product [Parascedosporium putredinis]
MSAAKRLVVAGGNGFLGSRICKFAVARGWDVTSISRSGEPRWDTVTASTAAPPGLARSPGSAPTYYAPRPTAPPRRRDCVVHSTGILLEADYKGIVRGTQSPLDALRKSFASSVPRPGAADPSRPRTSDPPTPATKCRRRPYLWFRLRHRWAPGVPARYLTTKREAEEVIASNFPNMRNVFLRPPFMYDASRGLTLGIAAATGAGTIFNSLTGGVFSKVMGAGGMKPVKVDTIAEGAVEALEDESVSGPVETERIEELATRSWRRSML